MTTRKAIVVVLVGSAVCGTLEGGFRQLFPAVDEFATKSVFWMGFVRGAIIAMVFLALTRGERKP